MTRHESREQAFAVVFERQFTDHTFDEIIEAATESRDFVCSGFCSRLLKGVEAHAEEIDAAIEANCRGWNLRRLSKVSLAVLRLAVYELLFEDAIPEGVSVNEAVELAKQYGSKEDASYVNGVLSGILRSRKNPETPVEAEA